MGGHGTFVEPRTGVDVTNGSDDLISAKLPALQAYQLRSRAAAPYFHNGTAPTLNAVVRTYNAKRRLGLTAGQMADLVDT